MISYEAIRKNTTLDKFVEEEEDEVEIEEN